MASMAAYSPRRFPNEGSKTASIGNIGIENLESKLLSNPQAYAKKAYIEDMVASVPTKSPYMADLENQLSAMFDATEFDAVPNPPDVVVVLIVTGITKPHS